MVARLIEQPIKKCARCERSPAHSITALRGSEKTYGLQYRRFFQFGHQAFRPADAPRGPERLSERNADLRRTALRTGVAVFIVGTVLYFFGESLFSVFGFTLDAFRIGAGALLFLTSVALMGEQRESHTPDSPDEDISVVPLAIPICMGPASIGTLMVLGASAHSMTERIIGSAALFVASALITLMLLMANHVQRILGKTGLAVLSKLTGLLLAAIAAQVVFTGVKNFLIVG